MESLIEGIQKSSPPFAKGRPGGISGNAFSKAKPLSGMPSSYRKKNLLSSFSLAARWRILTIEEQRELPSAEGGPLPFTLTRFPAGRPVL